MSTPNRIQAGIPEGGQFSEMARARPDTSGLGGLPGSVVDVETNDAGQVASLAQRFARINRDIDRVRLRGPEDLFSDAPYRLDAAFDAQGRPADISSNDRAQIDTVLASDIGLNAEKAGSWMVADCRVAHLRPPFRTERKHRERSHSSFGRRERPFRCT